jgi:lysophospholipase L1-like esterase
MTYPSQLQQMLGGNYVVTNLGASGATLQKKGDSPYWNRPQFQTLIQNKWDIVIIMLGTNDAKDKGSGGPPNWTHDCAGSDPLANCAFATDYGALVAQVRALGNPKIYIMIPPPLMQAGAIGANQTVINSVFPTIVPLINAQNKLPNPPINVFSAMGGVPDWQSRFPNRCALESPWPDCKYWCDTQSCDQCHPNDDGYKVLANTVHQAL